MAAKYEYKLIDPSTWELKDSNKKISNYNKPVVLPDDTIIICGKQSSIVYSTDRGVTYKNSSVNNHSNPAVLHDGITLVVGGGTLSNSYGGGGIKYSTNKGVSWQDSDITTGNYNTPAVLPDDTLVIGSSDSDTGIKYSTDRGVTWQDSNITTGNYVTPAILHDGTIVIGSDSNSGIKYSTDKGKTWHDSSITSGKYGTPAVLSDGTLVVSGNDAGIKYSIDKGVTWKNSNITIGKYGTAAVLSDDTLVICGKGNNIRYSTDKGKTWQDSYTTIDGYNTTTISADGYYTPIILPDNTLIICSDSTSYYSTGWGIRYSTDKGATWQKSNITSGVYAAAALSDGTLVICDTDRNTGIKYFKALDLVKVTDKYLDKAGLKVLVDKIKEADTALVDKINEATDVIPNPAVLASANSGRDLVQVLGKTSLKEAMQELKKKSDAKDYSGLCLGDYIEFDAEYGDLGNKHVRYEIVSFGHYGYIENGNSTLKCGQIVFMAADTIGNKAIGASGQKQYFGSPMDTFLASCEPAVEAALGIELKIPDLYQQYNDGSYDEEDWCDDDSGYYERKLFLPSIIELTGSIGYGGKYQNVGQFELMAMCPSKITASAVEWTRTPSCAPGHFCAVGSYGDSYGSYANVSHGVRPVFIV